LVDYAFIPYNQKNMESQPSLDKQELRYWIGAIYITLISLWMLLIYLFGFWKMGLAGIMICAIPLVTYIISMDFVDEIEHDDETPTVVVTAFLTFCLLVVAILSNWNSKKISEKTEFFKIIVVGVILVMFSIIEVWLPKKYEILVKYLRSGLRTIAFTLFILALYKYYDINSENEYIREERVSDPKQFIVA